MANATDVRLVATLKGPAGGAGPAGPNWLKGLLPAGTNLNNFRQPGVWIVPHMDAVATITGLPDNYPGIVTIESDVSVSTVVTTQRYATYASGAEPYRAATYKRVSAGSSMMSFWTREPMEFGNVPAGQDMDLLTEGRFGVPGPTNTTILNGPPNAGPGWVDSKIIRTFAIMKVQFYYEYAGSGGEGRVFYRSANSTTTMGSWKDLTATGGGGGTGIDYEVENPFANDQRKQWFIRRRGGFIGTGGKAAVAIRIDHGAGNMRDLVLNELVSRSLPWGMAINPGKIDITENGGVTWAQYNEWSRFKGMEPWNHGMTHGDATSTSGLLTEIVGARELLQTNMPDSAIEGWMVPGVGGTGYGGQSSTNAVDSFFGYEAGRIIMSSHAVSSGYGGGDVRPQIGSLIDGQDHLGLDSVTDSATIVQEIQRAQDTGGAVQLFLHPSLIGEAGRTTVAVLNQVWDFLATERDAGRIIMLSPSGLLLADPSKATRRNLIRFSNFQTTNGRPWYSTGLWSGAQGWTIGGGGVSTTTAGLITQSIAESLIRDCRGALYEIIAEVSSTDGAVARIGSSTLAGAMKDVTLAAGQTRTIRQLVTLPMSSTADFNVTVGRVSGGQLTVKYTSLQPV